ncbi:MAG: lysophospholipid acyltransferase family protein [Christensenellales bacterium]|jgi:1-acyl-sn-glycerol-3-phosphate acyltransferase
MSDVNRRDRTPFYSFARIVLGVFFALIYPVRAHNREKLDQDAPFIIVSNHGSMLDPLAISVKCKRHEIRWLGKKELTTHPVVRWLVTHLHMITLDRHMTDLAAMRTALQVLKQGHVLGIFPEGTRRKPEETMQMLEPGVSLLALRAQVPLVPVLIKGTFRPFRRVDLYVGDAIAYDDLLDSGMDRDTRDKLTVRIAEAVLALGK